MLRAELDRWAAAERTATFWWRDDDAVTAGPALDRLFAAAGAVPLALAVVPMQAEAALAAALAATGTQVAVLQHGHRHTNHAAPGTKKAEFTDERDLDAMTAEVQVGRGRLFEVFGARSIPIFVPPWNRCPAALTARLADIGHRVLSAYGPRPARHAAPGLLQVNTHADPIDWRGTRRFLGLGRLAEALAGHLAARRQGTADAVEPTGLLTHHLVHEPEDMAAIGGLVAEIAAHAAARWLAAVDLLEAA
ncbi:hypothetical protein [Rhodospirillaceae bacterium SYSU D60015]|uniref:hypothetical protein n=1 Tax=Desertibaculum subflavum TaxID=2268458 RepID=UPI000E65F34F